MNAITHPYPNRPRMATAASAITAALVVLSLSACGPHDASEPAALAGGAAPTGAANSAPVPSTIATAPQAVPAPQPGQVIATAPPSTDQQARYAAAPTYVAPPTPYPAPTYAPPPTYPARPYPQAQAPQYQAAAVPVQRAQPVVHDRMGSIESIEPIHNRPQGSGAGAVIGGVLGAVVGNQFGHGLGRAAVTGLGAVGGAVAGNNVERNIHQGVVGYRVSVRLDNGSTRTFERSNVGGLRVGDRVHVDSESFHRA